MSNTVQNQKPHFAVRLLIIILLACFALIENNPVVRLEAVLGLSPSPIERFFGTKSLFSGMTEGVHQFVRLNIMTSVEANIFSPLVIPALVFFISTWRVPKIDTKKKEQVFFLVFIAMSAIVNIVN